MALMHHSGSIAIVWRRYYAFLYRKISAKRIASETPPVEDLYVEVKLRKQKWLVNCSFNPNKSMISQHMEALGKNMDIYFSTYENFIFFDDFNAGMVHSVLKDFAICILLLA